MDHLTDKTWALHHTTTTSPSYTKLFTSSTSQAQLSQSFNRLSTFLQSQRPQYKDDLNDESEKLGSLKETKSTIHSIPAHSRQNSRSGTQFIHIALIYQHTTFTFILYTPHLILAKSPISHTRYFLAFLAETFNTETAPLKLPRHLLSASLQTYINTISSRLDKSDDLAIEQRVAVFRSVLGALKLTIAFQGNVTPHMKALDIGVPFETVEVLSRERRGFLKGLVEYLYLQTGFRLPMGDVDLEDVSEESEARVAAPLWLSKVTCAAFALSVDGRLRFAGKPIEVVEYEDVVIAANSGLLDGIVQEVKRRESEREKTPAAETAR